MRNRIATWSIRVLGILVAVVTLQPAESNARVLFQAAPPVIQVPSLAGYWCVDGPVADTGTLARDSSGNANTGTYTAGATSMASAPSVPSGNLRSFALTQTGRQYINVPDSASLSITGSMTVAAWIHPTVRNSLQQGIVEKWDEPGATGGYMFRLDAAGNLSFDVCSATGPNGVSTAPRAVPLNAWTHVAGVYSQSGGTITNYVNATADPSVGTGISPPTNGTYALQIGDDHGANAFNGSVDEVRLYSKALTASEVGVLKNGQPAPTGLVAVGGTNQVSLTWSPPSNAAAVPVQYSVLRGPSPTVTDTVFNNVMTPSYTDASVATATPYYYAVVAVSVMASAPSNQSSATPTVGPPPPPRTSKSGQQHDHMCGVSTAGPDALSPAFLAALLAAVLAAGFRRKRTFSG